MRARHIHLLSEVCPLFKGRTTTLFFSVVWLICHFRGAGRPWGYQKCRHSSWQSLLTASTWDIPSAQRTLPNTVGCFCKPHRQVGPAGMLHVGRYSCRSHPLRAGAHYLTTFSPGVGCAAWSASPGRTIGAVFAFFSSAVSRSLVGVLTLLSSCGIRCEY